MEAISRLERRRIWAWTCLRWVRVVQEVRALKRLRLVVVVVVVIVLGVFECGERAKVVRPRVDMVSL